MKKIVLSIIIVLTFIDAHCEELLKLSAPVLKSYLELKSACETFDKLTNFVKEIENGNTPKTALYASDWKPLIDNYLKAAHDITNAPLPTDFNPELFSVSISDINNCYLKDINIKKLRDYKKEMDNAIVRGKIYLDTLSEFRVQIKKTDEALQYLIKVYSKLSSVPIYNEIFKFNWFELESAVRPALSELSNAVQSHEKKINNVIPKIQQAITNLTSNTDLLEKSLCVISGTYTVTETMDDLMTTFELTISKVGSQYSGILKITSMGETDVLNIPIVNIVNNRYLKFS
ncbi:MAG TPA: hypothetical protein VF298_04945, partial [Bacteroidales bacterium]